jgi:hypothetical protein
MTKVILIRVSDSEYSEIEGLVSRGYGRTKADFVKTATVLRIEKTKENERKGM